MLKKQFVFPYLNVTQQLLLYNLYYYKNLPESIPEGNAVVITKTDDNYLAYFVENGKWYQDNGAVFSTSVNPSNSEVEILKKESLIEKDPVKTDYINKLIVKALSSDVGVILPAPSENLDLKQSWESQKKLTFSSFEIQIFDETPYFEKLSFIKEGIPDEFFQVLHQMKATLLAINYHGEQYNRILMQRREKYLYESHGDENDYIFYDFLLMQTSYSNALHNKINSGLFFLRYAAEKLISYSN